MNFNVYLPDDLGRQAKTEELKLSRLLREAVTNELHRRGTMREALEDPEVYEIEVGDDFVEPEGDDAHMRGTYLGRITGKLLHEVDGLQVYVTSDHRVIIYYDATSEEEGDRFRFDVLEADASERELVEFLRTRIHKAFEFAYVCRLLGARPVVDL